MGSDEGCPKRNSVWRAISQGCVGMFDENARLEADRDHSEEEEERTECVGRRDFCEQYAESLQAASLKREFRVKSETAEGLVCLKFIGRDMDSHVFFA
jgi:hypothetical protein